VQKLISLTLFTKPGCHLCEEAKTVVDSVLNKFKSEHFTESPIELIEVNILEDRALLEKYGEEIPVLQINGATHAYWRIDPERLMGALDAAYKANQP
jgi:glutaredoxin